MVVESGPLPEAAGHPGHLLCVANYPANTGFAWTFIEGLYAGLADRLAPHGVETWVAYPRVESPPDALRGSRARWVEQALDLGSRRSVASMADFIEERGIGTLYLSDRPTWSLAYPRLRRAGLRTLVVHDHTSGHRRRPVGPRRWLKKARLRIPGTHADRVLAVSDFVTRRKVEVDLLPPEIVTRIWNSVPLVGETAPDRTVLRERFEIGADAPVVVSASRASREKGVHHLLRAFDRVCRAWAGPNPPVLVYMGDGPYLEELHAVRDRMAHADRVRLPGYVDDARELLGGGDVAAVPSTWAEAFGLAALEPMSRGVPVVASEVGGIPEVVRHEEEGLLVPPGDEPALAHALLRLLRDPHLRRTLGERGRERAVRHFSHDRQMDRLADLFRAEMGLAR